MWKWLRLEPARQDNDLELPPHSTLTGVDIRGVRVVVRKGPVQILFCTFRDGATLVGGPNCQWGREYLGLRVLWQSPHDGHHALESQVMVLKGGRLVYVPTAPADNELADAALRAVARAMATGELVQLEEPTSVAVGAALLEAWAELTEARAEIESLKKGV
jgi:hypothetical protein